MILRKDEIGLATCVLAAVVLALLAVAPTAAGEAEAMSVSGEIEISEYDDDGNVAQVTIYDSEWGSVLVLNNGKGAELLKHVGAVVTATGDIRELDEDSGYSYAIQVTSFTIDEPVEPEEEPGDDPQD